MFPYFKNIIRKANSGNLLFIASVVLLVIISTDVAAKNINQDTLTVKSNQPNIQDNHKVLEVKTKSPRTAMICSLTFPGLGQLYNGKKFKALLFFGGEIGLLYNSIYLNQKYKENTDDYVKNFYIENRNLSNWWLVGVVLISILDAYVDAHLYSFDESPDLSVKFVPFENNRRILLSFLMPF